jgi:hypothetical protein
MPTKRVLTAAEREIAPDVEEAAVACLTELAIQLSMLRRVAPPATVADTEAGRAATKRSRAG